MTDINIKNVPPEIEALFKDLKTKGFNKTQAFYGGIKAFHKLAQENRAEAAELALRA